MSTANSSIRDVLYEPPGPRTHRRIRIATAVSIVVIAVLAAKVVRRFYIAGQLGPKYWSLFARYTTWRFLGRGLARLIRVEMLASCCSGFKSNTLKPHLKHAKMNCNFAFELNSFS